MLYSFEINFLLPLLSLSKSEKGRLVYIGFYGESASEPLRSKHHAPPPNLTPPPPKQKTTNRLGHRDSELFLPTAIFCSQYNGGKARCHGDQLAGRAGAAALSMGS